VAKNGSHRWADSDEYSNDYHLYCIGSRVVNTWLYPDDIASKIDIYHDSRLENISAPGIHGFIQKCDGSDLVVLVCYGWEQKNLIPPPE
jgi:hypothetical protein